MSETASLDMATAAAARIGLALAVSSRPTPKGAMFVVSVSRDAQDWRLATTEIAIAPTAEEAAHKAIVAIRAMAPRIEKELAKLAPDPADSLALAGGVGVDGVISALRVERDGTVRLAPEDIAAIADAVYRRMRPRAKP